MISWDTHRPFSKDDCSFQSKTLCKKRLPKQPQFEWQGTIAAGTWFQRKQTCRNPNYVLVMKVWFWLTNEKCECAVLFTAPKMVKDWVAFYHHWCRDAGTPCMNMLCLKSCTAHTGFPCKDHSATLYMVHLSSSLQTVECKIQSVTVLQNQQKSACSCLAPESNRKRNTWM